MGRHGVSAHPVRTRTMVRHCRLFHFSASSSGTIDAGSACVRRIALLLLASVSLTIACTGTHAPNAPTRAVPVSSSESVGLTVRVLMRGSEAPIAAASVFQDDTAVGTTNGSGELRTNVPMDIEFHINVSAPGYVSLGATGSVRSEERWTFYLESIQP